MTDYSSASPTHTEPYVNEECGAQNKNERMSKWTNKQTNNQIGERTNERIQYIPIGTPSSESTNRTFKGCLILLFFVMESIDRFERAYELQTTWTENGAMIRVAVVLALPLMSLPPHQLQNLSQAHTQTHTLCHECECGCMSNCSLSISSLRFFCCYRWRCCSSVRLWLYNFIHKISAVEWSIDF